MWLRTAAKLVEENRILRARVHRLEEENRTLMAEATQPRRFKDHLAH